MQLDEDEERQDAEIEEEQRIIRALGGVCQGYGNPDTIVSISQTPNQLFEKIAEGAKYKFFDYKAMQWIACNFQYNFSLAHSLRRWAIVENVQRAISNLSRIDIASAEGDLWRAQFKGIAEFILLKTSKAQSDDAHIYHEFFVGSLFTNQLRQSIPHFVFVYAIFKCARPRFNDNNAVNPRSFCEYSFVSDLSNIMTPRERQKLKEYERLIRIYEREGRLAEAQAIENELESLTVASENYLDNPINYLVIENIEGGIDLGSHIRKNQPSFHYVLSYLFQVISALEMAFEKFDFCHYDMHSGNVLMRPINVINNQRTFIPVGYEKPNQGRYFVESNYIPTIIDYSRSHVQRKDATGQLFHHGNHLFKGIGVLPNRARPIYDIYKLVGFITMDILYKYDTRVRKAETVSQELIDNNEPYSISTAIEIASRISAVDFSNISRLWSFFPFFRARIEPLLGSRDEKLGTIFFILEEAYPGYFNITNKWLDADRAPLRNEIHSKFIGHLRGTFSAETQMVLFRGDQLPPIQTITITSCDFNTCQ